MIYECEKCNATLPPGVLKCPNCGDRFYEPVPVDATTEPMPVSGAVVDLGAETNVPVADSEVHEEGYRELVPTDPVPRSSGFKPSTAPFNPGLQRTWYLDKPRPILEANQVIGFIGALTLFVGSFLPIATDPSSGGMNVLSYNAKLGLAMLVLAVVSAVLSLSRNYFGLWLAGSASFALLINAIIAVHLRAPSTISTLAASPLAATGALQSASLSYGWAVLVIGSFALFLAAAVNPGTLEDNARSLPNSMIWKRAPLISCGVVILAAFGSFMSLEHHVPTQSSANSTPAASQPSAPVEDNASLKTTDNNPPGFVHELTVLYYSVAMDGPVLYVTGKLINRSPYSANYVSVMFDVLNANHKKVGTATDTIDKLAPGQPWTFRAAVVDNTVVLAKLTSVSATADRTQPAAAAGPPAQAVPAPSSHYKRPSVRA
jgi:hypothetical protein